MAMRYANHSLYGVLFVKKIEHVSDCYIIVKIIILYAIIIGIIENENKVVEPRGQK